MSRHVSKMVPINDSPQGSPQGPPQEFVTHWTAVRGVVALVLLIAIGPLAGALGIVALPEAPLQLIRQSLSPKLFKTEPPTVAEVSPPRDRAVVEEPEREPAAEAAPSAEVVEEVVLAHIAEPPVSAAPQEAAGKPLPFTLLGEYELLGELESTAVELDLRAEKDFVEKILHRFKQESEAQSELDEPTHPLLSLLSQRSDLRGLPLLGESACLIEPTQAKKKAAMSFALKRQVATFVSAFVSAEEDSFSLSHELELSATLAKLFEEQKEFHQKDVVSTLEQMLQVENISLRLTLIDGLSSISGPEASEALAHRAMYDLSPDVRHSAQEALRRRPREEYRHILLKGLRYPWPAVADFAAQSLVAVEDIEAVEKLVELLAEPDPSGAHQNDQGEWVVRELARVNHLRNCLLCHAPTKNRFMMSGAVPSPGVPLPIVYYSGRVKSPLVRADVTYLRQDFSTKHEVEKPDKWPAMQRFDYFIRDRAATDEEIAAHALSSSTGQQRQSYPQRESVLFALRTLTWRDAGDSAAAWRDALRLE